MSRLSRKENLAGKYVIIYMRTYITALAFFIIGYLILIFNPYKATDYVYFPMVVALCMGGLYIFFSAYKTFPLAIYFKKIGFYILLFFALMFSFFILKFTILYLSRVSFWAIFSFYVIVVALIANRFEIEAPGEENTYNRVMFLKYLILYIPCLFKDAIDFIVQDTKQTTTTTLILGLCLVGWIALYILIPMIQNYLYITDGVLLIDRKTPLHHSVLTLSLKELNDRIQNTGFLGAEGFKSISDLDLERSYPNLSNLSLERIPYWNEVVEFFTRLKNDFFMIPPKDEAADEAQLYTYHYGLSFWLYLDTNILTEANRPKALVLSLGSRPSMYYDYDTRQLVIEITDYINQSEIKQKRIYYSSKLLFQRWNHIVMNYAHGQFDLFINNALVATQSNVSPYISTEDVLQVGSIENNPMGGISNFKYYQQPLTLDKIKSIYTERRLIE